MPEITLHQTLKAIADRWQVLSGEQPRVPTSELLTQACAAAGVQVNGREVEAVALAYRIPPDAPRDQRLLLLTVLLGDQRLRLEAAFRQLDPNSRGTVEPGQVQRLLQLFDLPEAEGELVGGFHTEYSTLKFAVFFLAEYINLVTVSALATTLFLGGWRAPWPISLWSSANTGWWPVLWFLGKVAVFIFVFIWLRGTLPRLRYDQFMSFGWKALIPISLVWTVIVSFARAMRNEYDWDLRQTVLVIAIPIAVLLLVLYALESIRARKLEEEEAVAEAARAEFDPMAGGFPVPPLPGQTYTAPRRTRSTVGATITSRSEDSDA
jgi:hypothetical protein